MTRTLTDRYIAATVRLVPKKHRDEIAQELRGEIADATEARAEDGQTLDDAEYATLAELGDPARLAPKYAHGATSLIGPRTYPIYVKAVRWGCLIILPLVYIVTSIGYWVRQEGVGAAIFAPLGTTATAAAYLLIAITVLFLLVDRFSKIDEWTPRHLPHI